MIRITYDIVCDFCKRQITTETYNCSNALGGGGFPQPKNNHTYQIGYSSANEICDECATPIMKARDEVIDKLKEQRK